MENEESQLCHAVTPSEAYYLLEPQKSRHKTVRTEAYNIFRKCYEYTEIFGKIKDKSVIEDLRIYLKDCGFKENEIVVFGTLFPQSIEEAKIYIPSLNRLEDEVIEKGIQKIQNVF